MLYNPVLWPGVSPVSDPPSHTTFRAATVSGGRPAPGNLSSRLREHYSQQPGSSDSDEAGEVNPGYRPGPREFATRHRRIVTSLAWCKFHFVP